MSEDPNKWKGPTDPLPGMNARNGPGKPAPKPGSEPAPKPQKREWRAGDLPASRQETAGREAGQSGQEQPRQHQAGTGHEALQSVLPVHADQPQDEEARPTMVEERNRLWYWPLLGLTVVAGIIVLVALVVMQQPLSNWTRALASTRQKDMIQAKQQAEYAELAANVETDLRQVRNALLNLDSQNKGLAAEAERRLGQPLQRLQSDPQGRPRELDLAILESKDNAAAWANLINATSDTPESHQVSATVAEIESRAHDGTLVPADRQTVAGLLASTAQQEQEARKRAAQVQRLLESLEARKFETNLISAERPR
jgi:hypothetical protein